jgi:hypothetical protein
MWATELPAWQAAQGEPFVMNLLFLSNHVENSDYASSKTPKM